MDPRPIAKALPGDDLAPWEEQYARWLATQTARVDADAELACVAALLGHPLTLHQIKKTKRKLAWKRCYQMARAELFEVQLAEARNRAMRIAPKAMKAYGKAVNVLDEELDRVQLNQRLAKEAHPDFDKDLDHTKPLRVAPHLLNPFFDRVAPKRSEKSESGPKVVINLSAAQSKGIDAPVMVVSAEEVPSTPALPSSVDE